jgi:hypothetical protein
VTLEAKLAERGVEEAVPLAIVGLVDAQRDGVVGADGDRLEDGGRGWVDGEFVGGGSSRVRGRQRHGCGSGGEGIDEMNLGR